MFAFEDEISILSKEAGKVEDLKRKVSNYKDAIETLTTKLDHLQDIEQKYDSARIQNNKLIYLQDDVLPKLKSKVNDLKREIVEIEAQNHSLVAKDEYYRDQVIALSDELGLVKDELHRARKLSSDSMLALSPQSPGIALPMNALHESNAKDLKIKSLQEEVDMLQYKLSINQKETAEDIKTEKMQMLNETFARNMANVSGENDQMKNDIGKLHLKVLFLCFLILDRDTLF